MKADTWKRSKKLISIDLSGRERWDRSPQKRPSIDAVLCSLRYRHRKCIEFRIRYLNEGGDECIFGAYDEDDRLSIEEIIEEMDGEVIEIEEYPKA
jgi:hypothetical protein